MDYVFFSQEKMPVCTSCAILRGNFNRLPVVAKPRPTGQSKVRAVIHAGNGLTWSQVTIELTGN
jgi:hypothetical protein